MADRHWDGLDKRRRGRGPDVRGAGDTHTHSTVQCRLDTSIVVRWCWSCALIDQLPHEIACGTKTMVAEQTVPYMFPAAVTKAGRIGRGCDVVAGCRMRDGQVQEEARVISLDNGFRSTANTSPLGHLVR